MATATKTKNQTIFALVGQWKANGVTKKAFCVEHNINFHTFGYWVAKRRWADQPTGGFVAVDIKGARPFDPITITYPNGMVASCPANLPLTRQLIHLI